MNSVPTNYTLDLAAPLTQVLQDCSNTYLYGLARLAQQDVSQTLYFLSDALDSVRQLADVNGDLIAPADYSPFGVSTGLAETSYGYTGEWAESGTGLLYLRSRWYNVKSAYLLQKTPTEGFTASHYLSTDGPMLKGIRSVIATQAE